MGMQKRMVLFPFGVSENETLRERCEEVLLSCCDADIGRFIDRAMVSFTEYAGAIGKLQDVVTGATPPIIVITRVDTLALNVVRLREDLLRRFPELARALWVLCVDPVVDTFFDADASRLGTLEPSPDHPTIWRMTKGGAFLVITPEPADHAQVRASLKTIQHAAPGRRASSTAIPAPSSRRKP